MNIGRISPLSFGHMSRYWNEKIECVNDINTGTVNNKAQKTGDPGVNVKTLQKNHRLTVVNPNAKYMYIQYESDIGKDKTAKPLGQDEAKKTVKNANIRAISEFDKDGKLVTRREFIHSKNLFSSLLATYSSDQEHCAFFSPKTGRLTHLKSFETNACDEYFLAEGEIIREDGSTKKTISEQPWGNKHCEREYDEAGNITHEILYDEAGNIKEETEYYENGDWRSEIYATFNGCRLRPYPDKIIEHDHTTGENTKCRYRPKGIKGDIMDLNGIV